MIPPYPYLLRTPLAILAGLVALSGCLSQPEDPLRIGLSPWPGYDILYLAAEKGWIREAGGNVEIVALTSNGDSRRAFERGQVDAFGGTTVELLLARRHANREARAFYATNWSEGADQIVASPPLESMADLRGKRIGVEPASLNLLVLATALDRAGIPYDAVERVALPQADLPDAVESGRIDAAVSYPPVCQTLKDRFGMRTVFDTGEAPRTVLDLLIADAGTMKRRPEDFAAIVRAFHRAARFAAENPREAHRILGRREGLEPDQVGEILQDIRVLDLTDQAVLWQPDGEGVQALERTADILHTAGHLPQRPAVGHLMEPSAIRAAAEQP